MENSTLAVSPINKEARPEYKGMDWESESTICTIQKHTKIITTVSQHIRISYTNVEVVSLYEAESQYNHHQNGECIYKHLSTQDTTDLLARHQQQ